MTRASAAGYIDPETHMVRVSLARLTALESVARAADRLSRTAVGAENAVEVSCALDRALSRLSALSHPQARGSK